MKRKIILIVIAMLLIINLSALTTIGYHRFVSNKPTATICQLSGDDYLYQELALSRSQLDQMKTIRQSFLDASNAISEQLLARRTTLVAQLKTASPDSEAMCQLLHEISSLQNDLQHQVIASVLRQKAILNSEQQEKFFDIIGNRLIQEARCKHANALNTLENNCNHNYNQPKN
ncbi:MAG: periplasmic heavy metal sensor [bacterium]|jgi:Spy/CpxP family protein refolding chaperone|nr:periplasmic heavy metal sensor [bacterium]